jgi:hypothetical protein
LDPANPGNRLRAVAEDRIRSLKDAGMRGLPYHDNLRSQIWLAIVASPPTCWPGPKP